MYLQMSSSQERTTNILKNRNFPLRSPNPTLCHRGGGGDPLLMLGWFVCPTVSLLTTSTATGLRKTPLDSAVQCNPDIMNTFIWDDRM